MQNAETVLTRRAGDLVPCGDATPVEAPCEAPAVQGFPHLCRPTHALCLRPSPPAIALNALWERNRSSWYRWDPLPQWEAEAAEHRMTPWASRTPEWAAAAAQQRLHVLKVQSHAHGV